MNQEQYKQLLKFLANTGFKGAEFEADILRNIADDRPVFKVQFDVAFEKEQMLFDLMFVKDYQFNAYRLDHYKAIYKDDPAKIGQDFTRQPFRDFAPNASGICNVNLAYYLLSGKLDELYGNIVLAGLEKFPGADVYSYLERKFSEMTEEFNLNFLFNNREGYAEFNMQIATLNNNFIVDNYSLSLTPHPEIKHGVHNDVDTVKLANLMEEIDWKTNSAVYDFDENRNPELIYLQKVSEVMQQLDRLGIDHAGKEIAMQLQLKYFLYNDFLSELIEDEVWDYHQRLPKKNFDFPLYVEVQTAFNLLCGGAIPHNLFYRDSPDSPNWIRLDLKQEFPVVAVPAFTTKEFEELVGMLPLRPADQLKLLYPLTQGSLVEATLKNERKVFLEANPEQRTINIYDENLRPIPANLLLDPDWKPVLSGDLMVERRVPEKVQNKQHGVGFNYQFKRKKGKGM
jgi:hypothetical protein